jgi:hypothetical protein
MMMIVPIDPDVEKTEYIADKDGEEWLQGGEIGPMWYLHFQHHDSDDNGQYAIAESFESSFSHKLLVAP